MKAWSSLGTHTHTVHQCSHRYLMQFATLPMETNPSCFLLQSCSLAKQKTCRVTKFTGAATLHKFARGSSLRIKLCLRTPVLCSNARAPVEMCLSVRASDRHSRDQDSNSLLIPSVFFFAESIRLYAVLEIYDECTSRHSYTSSCTRVFSSQHWPMQGE